MISYDKSFIREQITLDDIFQLLVDFGGEPSYTTFGIVSRTICHNHPADNGSFKLYYYSNSNLFHCFTGCAEPSFDIAQLVINVAKIQWNKEFNLNDALRWLASRFGIIGEIVPDDEYSNLEDWKIFERYAGVQEIHPEERRIDLKIYDSDILNYFDYSAIITPWIQDGISQDIMSKASIGYYPGGNQITIPHFNPEGQLIGVRGRTLSDEEALYYGKYRPLKVNQQWYNHPLGMNIYGLNWNKDNIQALGKAIIFESEKSVLQYATYFGWENNISVACCGSNISLYQIEMLKRYDAKEIIIALDRQFQEIGDDEYKHLVNNLLKINQRYHNDFNISFIFDTNKITGYKASPVDEGKDKFLKLFKERVIL